MTSLPFPLTGGTLVVGPSNTGKTRLTARGLESWVTRHGTAGVVVLEFAPELERDGTLLGGRLARFTDVPDGAWYGAIEARAPRAEGTTPAAVRALAAQNAVRARRVLARAPDPTAVFVNDATIPFQHAAADPSKLTDYCDRADTVVMNAFESDELGVGGPVSRADRAAVEWFRAWTDRVVDRAGHEG